ncbi:hypothetical protein RI367_001901 [Sorochytrium milnesiophthora]
MIPANWHLIFQLPGRDFSDLLHDGFAGSPNNTGPEATQAMQQPQFMFRVGGAWFSQMAALVLGDACDGLIGKLDGIPSDPALTTLEGCVFGHGYDLGRRMDPPAARREPMLPLYVPPRRSGSFDTQSQPQTQLSDPMRSFSAEESDTALLLMPQRWYHAAVIVTVCACTYGAIRSILYSQTGDAADGVTTILVSLDGFRADYLQRGFSPTLQQLAASGMRAQYMLPSFPSITFPNHYSIVTGLHPETHGIISNEFYDPDLNRTFVNRSPVANADVRWWTEAEPIWATAERQGVRTATASWPGSEAPSFLPDGVMRRPSVWHKYNDSLTAQARVDQVISALQQPAATRPKLVTLYIPDVDKKGHQYGPNSQQVNTAIADVDSALAKLVDFVQTHQLDARPQRKRKKWAGGTSASQALSINLIIVSDHGMAEAPPSKYIPLYDIVPMDKVTVRDSWPILMMEATDPKDTDAILGMLQRQGPARNYTAYHKADVPPELHFSRNSRIPEIIAIPENGFTFLTSNSSTAPLGMHGYVPTHPDMHAIFIASGPGIESLSAQERAQYDAFENIQVYGLLCKLLGIKRAPSSERPV